MNLKGSLNALQVFTPLAAPGAKLLNIGSARNVELRSRKNSGAEDDRVLCFREPEYSRRTHPPSIFGTEINRNIPVGPDTGICSSIFMADGGAA